MGETVDQTLTEIAATRQSLEHDIDELFDRLPDGAVVASQAKTYGSAAAGAAVLIGLARSRMHKRAELKERRQRARVNAEELARAFSPHEPRADLVEHRGGAGRLALLLAIIGGIVAAIQVAKSRNGA